MYKALDQLTPGRIADLFVDVNTGGPQKYSCLIECKMDNRRAFFNNGICLDQQ